MQFGEDGHPPDDQLPDAIPMEDNSENVRMAVRSAGVGGAEDKDGLLTAIGSAENTRTAVEPIGSSELLHTARLPVSEETTQKTDLETQKGELESFETCSYSIVVRTSTEENAGTLGAVFVVLTDSGGVSTDRCRLEVSTTHEMEFCRGHADLFLLVDMNLLADIQYIDVWHVKPADSREHTAWKLAGIDVIEHRRHRLFQFPASEWFGKGGEKITHRRLTTTVPPIKVFQVRDFSRRYF